MAYIENSPTSYESDEDSDDSSIETTPSTKKKKAGALGSFALEKKPEAPKEDFWSKFKAEKPDSAIAKLSESDPEAAPETEAPEQELGTEEKQLATRAIVEQSQEEDQAEPDPSDPVEQAAIEAVEDFRNRIIDSGQDAETAYQETIAELDSDLQPTPETETDNQEPVSEARPFATFPENQAIPLDSEAAAGHESRDEPNEDQAVSEPPARTTPPPPPVGPTQPFERQPMDEPEQPRPAVAPVPVSGERAEYQPDYQHGNPAAAALIGGIVGYFIGRRRGRIRTEKKLLPIQKKLKQQVEDLQWDIKAKEKTIYRIAAEKVQAQPSPAEVVPLPVSPAKLKRELQPTRQETPKAERIGQMLVTAESAGKSKSIEKSSKPEKPKTERAEKATEKNQKTVATMNRTELLELSDKVIIDGTSLRQIYETKLVGERGLRRLIVEHLRGGDVHKLLRQEITEREIDFERDPALRDQVVSTSSINSGAATSPKLDRLLEKAAVSVADSQEQAAFYRARADYQQQQHDATSKRRRAMDITLTAVIATLVAAVIILYFVRG